MILEKLVEKPELLEESQALVADLENWEFRLNEALERESHFCVIFHGAGWNGMEMEQRKGHF